MTAKNLILILVCLMACLGNFVLKPALAENSRLKQGNGLEARIKTIQEASGKLSELPDLSVSLLDADLAGPLIVSGWLSTSSRHGVLLTKAVSHGTGSDRKDFELSSMLTKDELTGRMRQKMAITGTYTSLAGLAEFLVEEFSTEAGVVLDEMSIAGYGFELTVSIFVRERG
jgi:hypothetical protein